MRRTIVLGDTKYVLRREYEGFGIYQKRTPSGYFENQSWLVYNGNIGYVSQSFNSRCMEELMDSIDEYNEFGEFGLEGYIISYPQHIYCEHPNYADCRF